MGKNHIVINSQFQPFSYDQLVRPLQESTQAHMQLETDISEIAAKASEIGSIANQEKDPEIYAQYKKYESDLQAQAENLAKSGLNPTLRKDMLGMRTRFAEEIVPIQRAHDRIKLMDDEQRKKSAADGTTRYSTKASAMKLQDAIDNPMLSYDSFTGSQIAQQVAQQAQVLSQQLLDPQKQSEVMSQFNGQQLEIIRQYGYTPEAILKVMEEGGSPILNKMMDDVIDSTGVRNWGNESDINEAYSFAKQGLWSAVGKTDAIMKDNKNFMSDADRRAEARLTAPTSTAKGDDPAWFRSMNTISDIDPNSEPGKIQNVIDLITSEDGERGKLFENSYEPESVTKKRKLEIEEIQSRLERYGDKDTLVDDIVRERAITSMRGVSARNVTMTSTKTFSKAQDEKKLAEHLAEEANINKLLRKNKDQKIQKGLKEFGIDSANKTDEEILSELKKKQNESMIEHVKFDVRGADGSYKDFAQTLTGTAIYQAKADEKIQGVTSREDKGSIKAGDFVKSVSGKGRNGEGGGIVGAYYDRNAGDPKMHITTADGHKYTLSGSVLGNFKETMNQSINNAKKEIGYDAEMKNYEVSVKSLNNYLKNNQISHEQYFEEMQNLEYRKKQLHDAIYENEYFTLDQYVLNSSNYSKR